MKRFWTCLLVFGVLSLPAFAQVDVLMKKKARAIANSGATRGAEPANGSRPAGSPGTASGQNAPSGAGGASAQGQPNYQKLLADLAIIKFRSEATPDLKKRVTTDLTAAAIGEPKPSADAISKLADDLVTGLIHKKFSTEDQTTLAQNIVAALNSGTLSVENAQSHLRSAQTIMKTGEIGEAELKPIMADLAAIVAELQKDAKPAAK